MSKENSKVDINKHEIDIETLKKQNVNDLCSIKELYSKLKELEERILRIKYIDSTLASKLKKEYEKLKSIILDENVQVQLSNKIDDLKINVNDINSQMNTNANEITQFVVTSDNIQSKIDNMSILFKKKELVIDTNLILDKTIELKDSIVIRGIAGVEITGVGIKPFSHSGGKLKNITLENLTFNGTDSFELEGIENITIKDCKFKNINGVGIGWFKGCKNVTIENNIVQGCSNMGMKIEGTTYGESTIVNVRNNLIINAGDNGIAVRAINGNITLSNISGNTIINAGKAGIKLTLETASIESASITDCVISNNIINGWGRLVNEDGISCNNYKTEYNLNNVSIVNNVLSTNNENQYQRGFIGISKCSNVSVIGNNCRGSVLWNGIYAEIIKEVIISGNRIEGSCRDSNYQYISSCGGIGLVLANNSTISNNIIKNTFNRPAILVNKSRFNILVGNRCFDDQEEKTQTKGIDETNTGGDSYWSMDNIFIGNICNGNIENSTYTSRSINANNI